MGAIRRDFLDPETEAPIRVREAPLEVEPGRVSRRLKAWVFENAAGERGPHLEVHRTADLGALSEPDLEALYLAALEEWNPPC